MKYTNEQTIDLRRELLCSLRLVLFVPQGHFTSRYGGSRAAVKPRLRRRAASRNSPGGRQARTAVLPLIDCRAAFPAIPNAGGDRRERTGALLKRASAFPDSAGAVKPVGRRKAVQKARPLILRPPPLSGRATGRRYLIGESASPACAYEALSAKRARGTRSPSPRSPPKRVERSPLQTSRRNLPVTLSAQRATSDGVPAATIRPPASPPPGPISRM